MGGQMGRMLFGGMLKRRGTADRMAGKPNDPASRTGTGQNSDNGRT